MPKSHLIGARIGKIELIKNKGKTKDINSILV